MATAYVLIYALLNIDTFSQLRTLGLPVVPLEKFKKATLVLPSPFFNRRSTKAGSFLSPS
jgi:hypothetical protein